MSYGVQGSYDAQGNYLGPGRYPQKYGIRITGTVDKMVLSGVCTPNFPANQAVALNGNTSPNVLAMIAS